MAMTKDVPAVEQLGEYADHPVVADTVIYEGALVTIDADGFATNLVGADAATTFLAGIAFRGVSNAGGASGAKMVKVRRGQRYYEVALSSAAQTDVGAVLYATDENTFTLTSTGAKAIGHVAQLAGTNKVIVRLEPEI